MRTCTVDGCTRKHVAKGLCSGHYNRSRYTHEQRHPKREDACVVCGTLVMKYPSGNRYRTVCSYDCRYVLQTGRTKAEAEAAKRRHQELVGPLPKVRTTVAPTNVIPGSKRPFLSVACNWCGRAFIHDTRVTGAEVLYCTVRCAKARGRNVRKAREHGATGTFTLAELVKVWLRFDKCCAYCEQPTDGLPDPDHVNPLSRGGSNSITNILPSCRLCNSDKNDMTLSEWPADRARRGLPPRTTTWAVDDRRASHLVLSSPLRPSVVLRRAA